MKPKRSDPTAADAAAITGPVVLDSSALLAFLHREPGADVVAPCLRRSMMSTVNYAEVMAKTHELGIPAEVVHGMLDDLGVRRVDFNQAHAIIAAGLRQETRPLGLSLGDRACLALGVLERVVVLTADRVWADLADDIAVQLIR